MKTVAGVFIQVRSERGAALIEVTTVTLEPAYTVGIDGQLATFNQPETHRACMSLQQAASLAQGLAKHVAELAPKPAAPDAAAAKPPLPMPWQAEG